MKPKLIKRGGIWLCMCGKKFAAARTPSESYRNLFIVLGD